MRVGDGEPVRGVGGRVTRGLFLDDGVDDILGDHCSAGINRRRCLGQAAEGDRIGVIPIVSHNWLCIDERVTIRIQRDHACVVISLRANAISVAVVSPRLRNVDVGELIGVGESCRCCDTVGDLARIRSLAGIREAVRYRRLADVIGSARNETVNGRSPTGLQSDGSAAGDGGGLGRYVFPVLVSDGVYVRPLELGAVDVLERHREAKLGILGCGHPVSSGYGLGDGEVARIQFVREAGGTWCGGRSRLDGAIRPL